MGWSVGRSGDVIVSASDSKEAEGEKEMSSASFDDDDIRDRSKEPAATVIAPAHSLPFRVNAVLIGSMSVAVDDTTAAKCRPHRPRVDPSRAEPRAAAAGVPPLRWRRFGPSTDPSIGAAVSAATPPVCLLGFPSYLFVSFVFFHQIHSRCFLTSPIIDKRLGSDSEVASK